MKRNLPTRDGGMKGKRLIMNFLITFKMALKSLVDNKTRSALTMLGVIIGVAAVIAAVGFAQGSMQAVSSQIEGLGSNAITAMITRSSASRILTLEDLEKLEDSSPYIDKISPYIMQTTTVKVGSESKTTRVLGTDESYLEIEGMTMHEGRFLTASDGEQNEKVAVIGSAVVKKLFKDMDTAVGQSLKINGTKFLVVGVLDSVMNGADGTDDDMVIIPITVAQRTLKITAVSMFLANASSGDTVDLATQNIKDYLYSIFRDTDSYVVFTQEMMLSLLGNVSSIMMLILGSVATISLVVGGIGIMNIMLVSVSERTREIGIRKAIGAKRSDIMTQFLIESLLLTGIGGVIGIILGMLIIKYIIGSISIIQPVYSVPWIIAAFSISLIIGVVFGLFPAHKAAKLNPIDSLRNE